VVGRGFGPLRPRLDAGGRRGPDLPIHPPHAARPRGRRHSVIDSRTILVTQANWIRGTITNDVTVADVSPNNDWSEVQVELGDGAKMGSPYPTYGFIYNQPDDGLNTLPGNGTIIAGTTQAQGNEVAEAPTPIPVSTDAPDRNLQ